MKIIPIKLSVTTCYLIEAEGRYILIDTGYEEDWDMFCEKIKEVNVNLSQIDFIVLTHHHDDHCGLLYDILRENSSIRVVMSRKCRELIAKGENDQTHGGGLLNKKVAFLIKRKQLYVSLILHKKIDKAKNLKFRPYIFRDTDILVSHGMRLRDIGIQLEGTIIETPGHTVDSISILFDNGDCLVGDAAAAMLKFAGTKNCVIFICDMDEYYKSWEKIIASGAKMILPAHGKPFSVKKLKDNMRKNKAGNIVRNN